MCKHAPGFSVRKKAVPLQSRKLVLKDVGIKHVAVSQSDV